MNLKFCLSMLLSAGLAGERLQRMTKAGWVRMRKKRRKRRTWWRSTFRQLTGSLETEE